MEAQKSHAAVIQTRMHELQSKLTKLSAQAELYRTLEDKGLTTRIQWYFISQDIETMHQLVDLLQSKGNSLLEGCKMIINDH